MTRRLTVALTGLKAMLGVSALAHAMRHDGKAHVDLHARQETSVPDLLGSSAINVPPVSSSIPEITLTIVPLSVNNSLIPTISPSSIPGYSVPSFPITTVQEPVATVCPGQPADSGIFSILPFPSISTINATAFLPNGSSTVFSSGVTSTSSSPPSSISFPPADPNDARVVLDDNGCQTLFAPQLKAVCSTIVSPLGIPEVTVTDCDQYITFSSDTKICPTILPPTGTPIPLPTVIDGAETVLPGNDATNPSPDPEPADSPAAAAAVAAPQKRDDEGALVPDGVTAPADPDPAAQLPLPTATPSPVPGTYYACPWYDAARGGVPPRVRAIECGDGGDDAAGGGAGCTTFEERWSVTSFARTVTETRPISYSGPVVVTDGTRTYTTTISIATVTTATTVTFSPTVIKRRLLEAGGGTADASNATRVAAPAMGRPSTGCVTSTLTETEYVGTATSEVAAGQGGVRTIELLPGPEGA